MRDEPEVRQLLRQWIVQHCKHDLGDEGLRDDTPILEAGLLSSLEVAEFVLYIEHLLGAEIPLEDLEADVFHSVDALWQRVFAPRCAPARGARGVGA